VTQYFNQLTPAQLERLALLSEELGEAQQAIGKILRHGYESGNPDKLINQGGMIRYTNRMELMKEMGDVRAALSILMNAGDLDAVKIGEYQARKLINVEPYLHHTTIYGE
jgi:hypothetical protein